MAWARLDDRFHDNRKIKRVWRRQPTAVGLHVMAITYCAGHLTDGLVDLDFVEDRIPNAKQRERVVSALVDAGLWHPAGEGWQINDFAEFNVTRERAESKHNARVEAGKKGAVARWGDSNAIANAMATDSDSHIAKMANDAPDPARILTTSSPPTKSEEDERAAKERAKASDDDRRLCRLLAESAKEFNPKAKVKSDWQWLRSMRLLREQDGNSPDEIERLICWMFAAQSKDARFWAGTIQSAGGLRENFGRAWARMLEDSHASGGVSPESSDAFLARRGAAA